MILTVALFLITLAFSMGLYAGKETKGEEGIFNLSIFLCFITFFVLVVTTAIAADKKDAAERLTNHNIEIEAAKEAGRNELLMEQVLVPVE